MKVYPTPADGLADGLRLAGAMTRKNAMAELPLGGGKAVLAVPAVPEGAERRQILLRYADIVASMGGTYRTACDMNTTEADMDLIGERCPFVFGRSVDRGGSGTSAPATAVGVFHGIRASVAQAFGSRSLEGRRILVQGVGAVGKPLARLLSEAGAAVTVSDVATGRARGAAQELGARQVAAEDAMGTECDVLAPCATGGVLNPETIAGLRCRVVAGAANNQLGAASDAELLHAAGILYAPDYVINAGGIIHLVGLESLGWTQPQLDERLERIGDTLGVIFRAAEDAGISTGLAAERMVEARLAAAAK